MRSIHVYATPAPNSAHHNKSLACGIAEQGIMDGLAEREDTDSDATTCDPDW